MKKRLVDRLYLKRQNGGCGLVELESAYNAAIVAAASTLSKAEIGLPDQCKNIMTGKPNSLYKKKVI